MIRAFYRNRDGVVAVEMALLALPMAMMIGLVFFAGVGFYSQTSLTFAVQQGALASVAGQGADPQAVFAANAPSTLTGAGMSCSAGSGSTTCNGSGVLTVPFAALFRASDNLTLTATATAATPPPPSK